MIVILTKKKSISIEKCKTYCSDFISFFMVDKCKHYLLEKSHDTYSIHISGFDVGLVELGE